MTVDDFTHRMNRREHKTALKQIRSIQTQMTRLYTGTVAPMREGAPKAKSFAEVTDALRLAREAELALLEADRKGLIADDD